MTYKQAAHQLQAEVDRLRLELAAKDAEIALYLEGWQKSIDDGKVFRRELFEENTGLRAMIKRLSESRESAQKQRNDYQLQLMESRSQVCILESRCSALQILVDALSPSDGDAKP